MNIEKNPKESTDTVALRKMSQDKLPSNVEKVHKKYLQVPNTKLKLTAVVFDAAGIENFAYRQTVHVDEKQYLLFKTKKPTILAYEVKRLLDKLLRNRISLVVETVGMFPDYTQVMELTEVTTSLLIFVPHGHQPEFLAKKFREYALLVSGFVFKDKNDAIEAQGIIATIPDMVNHLVLYKSQE